MKHLLEAIAQHLPHLAPFAEAMQKDMAEQEAEFKAEVERHQAESERKREEMRRRSEERMAEILGRP